ncbi:MAG: hypothetical protein U0414_08890 [Polyangiaceae bacterium]
MSEKPTKQASPRLTPRQVPTVEPVREDANSRTTLEVDPAWIERNRASFDRVSAPVERPSLDRRTMDVEPDWLERDSRESPKAEEEVAARPRSAIPPPLPVAPKDEDEDVDVEPVRSAIPPPLPK